LFCYTYIDPSITHIRVTVYSTYYVFNKFFQNVLKETLYEMFDIILIGKNKKLIFKVNNSLAIYVMFIHI